MLVSDLRVIAVLAVLMLAIPASGAESLADIRSLLDSDRTQDALTKLNTLIDAQPQNAEALALRARANGKLKHWRAAELDANAAIKLDPSLGLAHGVRSFADTVKSEYQAALTEALLAVKFAPTDPLSLAALSTAYVHLGRDNEALKTAEQLIEIEPNAPAGYRMRAAARLKLNDGTGALSDLCKALSFDPTSAELLSQRAGVYRGLHDNAKAANDVATALAADPNNAEAQLVHAHLMDDAGNFDQAIREWSEFIRKHPTAEAYYQRGRSYARLGRYQENLYWAQQAVGESGEKLSAQQSFEQALKDFTVAERISPQSALAYIGKAQTLQCLNRPAEALENISKALQCDRRSPAAYLQRANILLDLKEYQRAADDCTQIIDQKIEADPDDLRSAYHLRSKALNKLGRAEASKADELNSERLDQQSNSQIHMH